MHQSHPFLYIWLQERVYKLTNSTTSHFHLHKVTSTERQHLGLTLRSWRKWFQGQETLDCKVSLFVSTIENKWRTVWKTYNGFKGLKMLRAKAPQLLDSITSLVFPFSILIGFTEEDEINPPKIHQITHDNKWKARYERLLTLLSSVLRSSNLSWTHNGLLERALDLSDFCLLGNSRSSC